MLILWCGSAALFVGLCIRVNSTRTRHDSQFPDTVTSHGGLRLPCVAGRPCGRCALPGRSLVLRPSELLDCRDGCGWRVVAADDAAGVQHARDVAYMVKHSEISILDAAWLRSHSLSVGSKTLVLSSRVLRVAPRLQMQSDEPVVAKMPL